MYTKFNLGKVSFHFVFSVMRRREPDRLIKSLLWAAERPARCNPGKIKFGVFPGGCLLRPLSVRVGRMAQAYVAYAKDPSARRRVPRPTMPTSMRSCPHLNWGIIDDALELGPHRDWARTRSQSVQPRGCCGTPYATLTQDLYGCATRRSKAWSRIMNSVGQHLLRLSDIGHEPARQPYGAFE